MVHAPAGHRSFASSSSSSSAPPRSLPSIEALPEALAAAVQAFEAQERERLEVVQVTLAGVVSGHLERLSSQLTKTTSIAQAALTAEAQRTESKLGALAAADTAQPRSGVLALFAELRERRAALVQAAEQLDHGRRVAAEQAQAALSAVGKKRSASERAMEDEMQAAMSGLRKRLDQIDADKENRLHAAKRRRSSSMAELIAMAQGLVG